MMNDGKQFTETKRERERERERKRERIDYGSAYCIRNKFFSRRSGGGKEERRGGEKSPSRASFSDGFGVSAGKRQRN